MKPLYLCFCFLLAWPACTGKQEDNIKPSDQHASLQTDNLLKSLHKLTQKGILFGHQDDLAYGIGWVYPEGESDVKRVCGDFPAVYGMDLGHLEKGSPVNLDSVPFEQMRSFARNIFSRGGVITISWHADNPLTRGSAWDISSRMTVQSVLPGGEKHEIFKQWLDRLANFFHTLYNEQGQAIPVIFRPYHEHTGSWFWWGKDLCTAREFIDLWRFTVNYLCQEKQVHHLLFAYSPSSGFESEEEYLERYPGDEYVDLIGFDDYQMGPDEKTNFRDRVSRKLDILSEVAAKHHKVAALTETGLEGIPDPEWWTGVLWPAVQEHPISYVLVWRNAHNRPGHHYAPYPGHVSEHDFIEFYNLPGTLFQHEITMESIYW
ncbi:MAG TPA: beta-mannosidase [Bacteroidetes bacterium]|nr:beta-mannosidase [Bacteroidota bacterium]